MKHGYFSNSVLRGLGALGLLATGLIAPLAASAQAPSLAAAASALVSRAESLGQVRVIVGLNVPAAPEGTLDASAVESQRQAISAAAAQVSAVFGADSVVRSFETIPYTTLSLTAAEVQRLATTPGVTSIHEDVPLPPLLDTSTAVIGSRGLWRRGVDGSGWATAVLDTGFYYRHRAFDDAVLSSACYSSNDSFYGSTSLCRGGVTSETGGRVAPNCDASISGCGHGTHVAATVLGRFPRAMRGVAPAAQLIAIQVFSRFPSTYCSGGSDCVLAFQSDQIAGLERVAAMAPFYDIASANLSLGGGYYASSCDSELPAYTAVVDQLTSLGVAVVIASGNSYYTDGVGFPACISNAVTVGATDDSDAIASFSNQANGLVDLMAPGVNIEAAYINYRRETAVLSGTSMATPHVAGAFAQLRQAKPTATVAEILAALQCTATSVSRVGTVGTFQRINVGLARQELLMGGLCP